MKPIRSCLCAVLVLLAAGLQVLGEDLDLQKAEWLRTGLTIAGAVTGLAAGAGIGIAFSLDTIDTPLSDTLLLTIPVAAVGAAAGALAGYWMAGTFLNSPRRLAETNSSALAERAGALLGSAIEGAGLGLVAGAFVGALTFSTNFAIAFPLLEVPEGYWGEPPIPMVAMALVAGGVWGGIIGAVAGAIALPIVSLILNF